MGDRRRGSGINTWYLLWTFILIYEFFKKCFYIDENYPKEKLKKKMVIQEREGKFWGKMTE